MRKRIMVWFCVLFVVLFAFQLCTVALAVGTDTCVQNADPMRFSNINTYSCSCIISGLKIYMYSDLYAKRSMSLSITIELQKLKSGSYETIETWSDSNTGVSMNLDADRLINLLATYRIKATFNAGGESVTDYAYP